MIVFSPFLKRIFVRLDDDPTQMDRKSVYESARDTLARHLKDSDASKEVSNKQTSRLERAIEAIELEYCDPDRPKKTTRPLSTRRPYRINGPARSGFIRNEFDALLEMLKAERPEASGAASIIRHAMRDLVRQIALRPEELDDTIGWRDLERMLFEIFDG